MTQFQEISLLLLSFEFVFGMPIFFYFRYRMSHNPNPEDFYRKRLFKLIFISFFIHTSIYLTFMLIFFSILDSGNFILNPLFIILSAVFAAMGGATYFGGGMYITSVVMETFTLPELRKHPSFKTQFIINNLFHGPISHIFIFSPYIVGLTMLAVMDLVFKPSVIVIPSIVLLTGIMLGFAFAVAQVLNHTAPYQGVTGVLCLLTFLIFEKIENWQVGNSALGVYLLGFLISFLSTLLLSALIIWKNKNIWGRSGHSLK